jgi:hypothetical protein
LKFTQELVDYLNQGVHEPRRNWLEENTSMLNFVTSACVVIRPPLFSEAQRVSVTDNHQGRFVTIHKRNGERSYIFQIENDSLTVEEVEALIVSIEDQGGRCHIERTCLIIDLPLGFLLDRDELRLMNVIKKRSVPQTPA